MIFRRQMVYFTAAERSRRAACPRRLPMSLTFSLDLCAPSETAAPSREEILLPGTNGRTLILVHGLTGTPNEMRHLAFHFHKLGYGVHCPRLANHGRPLRVLKRTRWEQFYGELRTTVLAAADRGERVYVGGLSMSALFALLLAEELGGRIAGVVCLAPTLFFDGWNVPWYNRLLPLASYTPLKYALYFKETPPYGIKNERIQAMVHRHYRGARLDDVDGFAKFGYAFFPVSLFHELRRLARAVVPRLPRVTAPVLLIHPREDDTASLANSQLIYDRISSPIKKLVILENSYHVITADQEREAVAREMEHFLAPL